MSLLMQALKKAERAKQNHVHDEEPGKPSEAFDQVLELAPRESAAAEPLSLSPLDQADPAPPHEFVADAAPPEPPRRARNPPPPPPPPRARPRRATPYLSARAMRLGALGAGVAIVASVFGYIYWNAMYGAGSSRHLPMVPMPGQNLPPALGPSLSGGPPALTAAPSAAPVAAGPAAASVMADAPPPSSRDQMPPDMYMRVAPPPAAPTAASPVAHAARRAPAEPATTPATSSDNGNVRVARATRPAQVNPALQGAYLAFERGDLAGARQGYQGVLRHESNNRDALLGMAAIAVHDSRLDEAGAIYARLLDLDPNDNDALAGMASVRVGDAGQSESSLRHAVERSPESGPALFALGNVYARQGRWPEAQQYYFRAYSSTPGNADYAFNLAVGLDRLNKGALALTYYRRALELAGTGPVDFERAAASARLRELGGQ